MARVLSTSEGTLQHHDFGPAEWALFAVPPLIWGCSFLLIAVGLDHFAPTVVTMLPHRVRRGDARGAPGGPAFDPAPRAAAPRIRRRDLDGDSVLVFLARRAMDQLVARGHAQRRDAAHDRDHRGGAPPTGAGARPGRRPDDRLRGCRRGDVAGAARRIVVEHHGRAAVPARTALLRLRRERVGAAATAVRDVARHLPRPVARARS